MIAPSSVFCLKRDLLRRARLCIGNSKYHYNAMVEQAPEIVNCYELIRWLFNITTGHLLSVQFLTDPDLLSIESHEIELADLIFVERLGHPNDDFGHVGFVTDNGNVIHATWRPDRGVFEESLSEFLTRGKYIGARRFPDRLYCRSS